MTFMTRDVQLSRDLQRVVSPILHFIYKTPSEFMIDRVIGQEWSWVLFLTIFYTERLSKKSQNHGGRLNLKNAMPSQSTCPILNDYMFFVLFVWVRTVPAVLMTIYKKMY